MTAYYVSTSRWTCLVVIDATDRITEAAPYAWAIRRRWEREIGCRKPMRWSVFLAECERRYGREGLRVERLASDG